MSLVKVHLYSQSLPCVLKHALNSYTKDGLYCVAIQPEGDVVYKFPIQHIYKITEIG